MKLEGTFAFRGSRVAVWDLLLDPEVLAKAMPGTKRLTRTGENRYEGLMAVSLGPITAAEFSLSVVIRDDVPPDRFTMQIDGTGHLGFARGTAMVELADAEAGGTTMRYVADLQIGGKVAAVGQRVLDAAARAMTARGLEAMQRELEARLAKEQAG